MDRLEAIGKINIHPGHGTWIECWIWGDFETMRKATSHLVKGDDHTACYIGLEWRFKDDISPAGLKTRKLGEIHLVDDYFGSGIFAHELQHFICHWITVMGWDISMMGEHWEPIAKLTGDLTREFWLRFNEDFEYETVSDIGNGSD